MIHLKLRLRIYLEVIYIEPIVTSLTKIPAKFSKAVLT